MPGGQWRPAMIGLDTNLVVRWLVFDGDTPRQSETARRTMAEAKDEIFLNDIVLAESAWVMSARYKLPRTAIAHLFRELLDHPQVRVSRPAQVTASLTAYEKGGSGLSDQLIGRINEVEGCRTTLTFDKKAAGGTLFTQVT